MQTIGTKSSSSDPPEPAADDRLRQARAPQRDLLPLLAGAATTIAGVGAVLALADIDSPLRAPFTLFFLLAAPTAAVAIALRNLEPVGRVLASLSAAVAVNLLVAQGMIAVHRWSVPGGIAAVAALSSLILLLVLVRRLRGRTVRRRVS
ncbi:hypothetical protein GCM10010372_70940 [Streptomyces tauricus]|uniref:hypothetical protein n=1 Tax=Streptomyces tauricus TaxID=68274 RepID=UPI00199CDAE0|nr:hypothetical protein [Streptomyces tauricus]MCW8100602.1 hypothetical protein [Streptomyces tauricus]GHA60999.1 hypothetical protein GCM10010372_70940 [Streptomyces tauricus]